MLFARKNLLFLKNRTRDSRCQAELSDNFVTRLHFFLSPFAFCLELRPPLFLNQPSLLRFTAAGTSNHFQTTLKPPPHFTSIDALPEPVLPLGDKPCRSRVYVPPISEV